MSEEFRKAGIGICLSGENWPGVSLSVNVRHVNTVVSTQPPSTVTESFGQDAEILSIVRYLRHVQQFSE